MAVMSLRRWLLMLIVLWPLQAAHANPDNWWVDIANDRAANVSAMLAEGADPNELSPNGQPAIMQAIREGAWQVYDVLLVHPKTVFNAINVNRETPLMYLAVIGETRRAEDLIRRGALVNRKGWTPLHYAASTGKIDTAKMLLKHGALVNAPAPDGTTALMMAAYGGSEPMVRLLLQAGADPQLRTVQGYDAVDWAGFKSNTRIAAQLRALIDGTDSSIASEKRAGKPAPQERSSSAEKQGSSTSQGSTSRYFDLERFDKPALP